MINNFHNQLAAAGVAEASLTTDEVRLHPLLRQWIADAMPELMEASPRAQFQLKKIKRFLSPDGDHLHSQMGEELTEDLYFCLLGLKSALKTYHYNWLNTLTSLEQHQLSVAALSLPKALNASF